MFPFSQSNLNRNGIPELSSERITVGTESVDFVFAPEFGREPYKGIIIVNLNDAIPTGTTATLPIRFTMLGRTANLTTYNGENVTVADIPGTGAYLVYYNRLTGALQLLNAAV